MNLVYFYARESVFDLDHYTAEGTHQLLVELVATNVLDNVLVLTESTAGQIEEYLIHDGRYVIRVLNRPPSYEDIPDPKSILWVRGGFKPWLEPLLHRAELKKHWVLFYGANTGNERWPFWNIVLSDLTDTPFYQNNHYVIPYRKPIAEYIFNYNPDVRRDIDVCLGASHIHDKKAQWLGYEVVKYYEDRYGVRLNTVLPGSIRGGGAKTTQMFLDNNTSQLVRYVGNLTRKELCALLRRTKVAMFLGQGGQGDRGPIEAMSCGCYNFLGTSKRHSSYVSDPSVSSLFEAASELDIPKIAERLWNLRASGDFKLYDDVSSHYDRHGSIAKHSFPMMNKVVRLFRTIRPGDLKKFERAYND